MNAVRPRKSVHIRTLGKFITEKYVIVTSVTDEQHHRDWALNTLTDGQYYV
jgi:hypothetical protein